MIGYACILGFRSAWVVGVGGRGGKGDYLLMNWKVEYIGYDNKLKGISLGKGGGGRGVGGV